ncbi:MAG: YhdP family protein [Pseudomonadota bacterium]
MQLQSLITAPFRFVRRLLLPLLGLLIILLAVLMSVAKMALPLFDEQARALVERVALQQGIALEVQRLSLDWEGLGPRLSLHDTRIKSAADQAPLQMQTLSLHLDVAQSALSGRLQFNVLEISGLSLQLQRDTQGRWGLSSLAHETNDAKSGDSAEPMGWPAWMGMAQRIVLSQSQLKMSDDISGLRLALDDVDVLFEQLGEEQRLALQLQLPATLGGAVELRARLHGSLGDLVQPSGEIWLNTPSLRLPGWRALFTSLPNADLALPVALSDLPQLKTGELDGQTWISLQQGEMRDLQASLNFNDVQIKRPQLVPSTQLPASAIATPLASHVNIHLQHESALWTLDLDTAPRSPPPSRASGADAPVHERIADALDPERAQTRLAQWLGKDDAPHTAQRFSMRRDGDELSLAAEHIDLELLRPWLVATPILPESMRRSLQAHRPLGMLQQLALKLDLSNDPPIASGQLKVADLGWQGHDALPGITGIDAEVWLDGRRALLRLDSEDISIDSAGQLRERLRFQNLRSDVALFLPDPAAASPRSKLVIHGLKLNNPDLALALKLRLDLPASGSPLIDAEGSLERVPSERIPAYLPVKVLEKDAVIWLDNALAHSQGFVPHAAIRLHGALDRFPYFPNGSGQFSVIADFERLDLDYAPPSIHMPAPGWPAAEKLQGRLSFINNGMSANIQSGQIKGVLLDHGALSIPDYDHPRLALGLKLHGDSKNMLDVLRHSPLFKSPRDLDAIQLSGAAKLDLDLGIRLDPRDQLPDRVEGWFNPLNARLQTFGLDFSRLNGTLHFVDLTFDSDNLKAELKQNPVSIQVASQLDPRTPASERGYRIDLATQTRIEDWLASVTATSASDIARRFPGRFALDARLDLHEDPAKQTQIEVDLNSDLRGLAINLPAPLGKSAETPHASAARLSFTQGKLTHISFKQPELLQAALRLDERGIRSGTAHFGAGSEAQEGKADEFLLSGSLTELKLDDWLAVFDGQDKTQSAWLPPALRISGKIQRLHALGGDWDKLAFEGAHDRQGWKIDVDAPRISGQLLYPDAPTAEKPVDVRLSRLIFPDQDEPSSPAGENAAKTPPIEPSAVDPASLPHLLLHIGELNYGATQLREIELRAAPQAAASHPKGEAAWLIQPLSIKGAALSMQGQAAWRRTAAGRPFSSLELKFASDDVGAALSGLGARHSLKKGRLENSAIQLSWPGGLHQFAWGGAYGQGQLHIVDGEIDKVELGAGRMLGLISLTELPRRLILDFGDVFGKGLHFERLDSEMTLNDGLLRTQRFELDSPALKLAASGFSNMLDQSLHYQMVATPSLGNVLPIVGVVAGGPLVGGATFVAQKLFEMAGGSFVSLNYQVSGTWDQPVIERGSPPEADEKTKPPSTAQ